jgi:uncharacterized protein (UPF0210 family)
MVDAVLRLARSLETRAAQQGIEYVSLGAVDTLDAPREVWRPLLEALPGAIGGTERVFCSATVGTRRGGINLDAARRCGQIVAEVGRQTPDGFGNLRFAALANCPPSIPFFPAAHHDGSDGLTVGIALEAADVAVAAFTGAGDLGEAQRRLVGSLAAEVRRVSTTVEAALPPDAGAAFSGVDLSLAPFPADDRSIAHAFEQLGLPAFGAHGTLFVASFLTDCLRLVSAGLADAGQAPRRVGFSGLMLPVLEDSVLAARGAEGTFGVDSLLLYSAACGLGLDTVPLPGDTSPAELGAIILDMATLAVRLNKPLTARLFPVPGKGAGDAVSWAFPYFAPSRVLPVRGAGLGGILAEAARYNPPSPE